MLFLVVFILLGVSLAVCGLLGFHTNFSFFIIVLLKTPLEF